MSWIKIESHNKNSDREKNYPFARRMGWLFLAASILLLIYTYYRAEITHQGAMSDRYFKYYLISLVGILFWWGVLRLREEIQANIVTIVTSLVVGLYMVEVGLTLFMLGQPLRSVPVAAAAAAAELGIEYDQRTQLGVIEDLISEGVDAVPVVYLSSLVQLIGTKEDDVGDLFPLAGIANKTTVFNNESGKYLIYNSDRHGFNNPDNQWDTQTVKLEWLLTGDSFAHGSAVQPGQEIAGQIRSITGNTAVSLGIGGNSPLVEYAALVEYGKALAPAKVLWVYYEGNDLMGDIQRDKINPLLMQYMQDGFSQNLINRQEEIDNRLEKYIVTAQVQAQVQAQAQVKLHKTRWIRLYAIRSMINFDVDVDVEDPLFTNILTKAKAEVEAWGGKLYFVYLPEHERYRKTVNSHDRFRKKSEVIDLVKGLDIPVIDIHQDVFSDHLDPLSLFPFRLFGHYNAAGYSEVSKAIVTSVKSYEFDK